MLPNGRYSYSSQNRSGRNLILSLLVGILLVVITLTALFFTGVIGNYAPSESETILSDGETLLQIWERKNYQEVNTLCEEILADNPLDYDALLFNGFSYFYRGIGQFSLEERLPLIDAAIVNLRKALTLDEENLRGKLYYILGKAYYQKGKFYSDLSLKYLEESIVSGYIGDDTYEYLGLVYSTLGEYDRSAENYLQAIEQKPMDTLYLALAQTYDKMSNSKMAEEYSIKALNSTRDYAVEEKSRFLLGKIYSDREEYLKAEDQYLEILDKNSNSADVHYYLGEIYEALGNSTKARFEWRKALEIDPYHYGARLKLY